MEYKKFPFGIKKLEKSINAKIIKDYSGESSVLKDILCPCYGILSCTNFGCFISFNVSVCKLVCKAQPILVFLDFND